MPYEVRVAAYNKDISSTDPNDFIFHSKYVGPKILTTLSASLSSGGSDSPLHSLGYTPGFVSFAKLDDGYVSLVGTRERGALSNYAEVYSHLSRMYYYANGTAATFHTFILDISLDGTNSPVYTPTTGHKFIVAKDGYEIDDTNLDHIAFHSDYLPFRWFASDIYETMTGSGNITVEISHNLGYYPLHFVQFDVENFATNGNDLDDPAESFRYLPVRSSGFGATFDINAYVDTSKLYVDLVRTGDTTDRAFRFKYFIFRNPIPL